MYILNPDSKTALHIQLYEQIKEDITTNYKVGDKLPAIRKMASIYNLSKTTVQSAYSQLVVEGYIEGFPGSGYKVEDTNSLSFKPINTKKYVEDIEEIDWLYDFFPARLSKDTFPLKLWKRLFMKYIDQSLDLCMYSDGQGEKGLRIEIAKYLEKSRGIQCHESQIVIGSGLIDSLSLLTRLLKKKKDNILALEHPGYYVTREVFESSGFIIEKIRLDKNGLKIEELKKTKANLVYVTPSHQYPTGVSMPISNRQKLLKWAEETDGFIIEDDYDSELNYINRPIPSLQGLDNSDRVIYLGTFSKSLAASLRVSYTVLPMRLMNVYKSNFSSFFSSVSLITQKTLEKFMSEGHWEQHLRKIRTVNRKKHNLMKELLVKNLGNDIKIESQGAGLAIFINPTVDIDLSKLKDLAKKERIKIHFTKEFCGGEWDALRMGFGGLCEDEINKAIEIFCNIWDQSKN